MAPFAGLAYAKHKPPGRKVKASETIVAEASHSRRLTVGQPGESPSAGAPLAISRALVILLPSTGIATRKDAVMQEGGMEIVVKYCAT